MKNRKITEDKDYGLFSVVVFKKFVDDFKTKARENKFIVRDFEYREEDIETERQERTQLGTDLKKQLVGDNAFLNLKNSRRKKSSIVTTEKPKM